MTRKLGPCLTILTSILLATVLIASCEVPAPGTPLPTITPFPKATTTISPTEPPTSTPTVAEPTATPAPPTATPDLSTATPTAEPSPTTLGALWPSRPAVFGDYMDAIIAYLNAEPVHIIRLRPMLGDWGAITERLGGVREADLDNDGELEWIVAIADPDPGTLAVPSELAVLDRQAGSFAAIHRITAHFGGFQDNVVILAAEDINADGANELAYTTTTCGAHTCFTAVQLLAWAGAEFRSLTEGQIEMPYGEVSLENRDDDPALELVLHGGMIGSVGAGPQRTRSEIYDWRGTFYAPSATIYDESDFLYFRVLDANTALLGGDFTRAIALYEQAIDNASLRVWHELVEGGRDERQDLVAFSRFRLSLTYLLMNDLASADAVAQTLQQEQPDHVYNQATQVLLDYFTKEGSVTAACQVVTEFAYEFPETAAVLEDFGYTNPTFTVDQVCPAALANLIP